MVPMSAANTLRTIDAGTVRIGPEAGRLALIAGPCIIESLDLCRKPRSHQFTKVLIVIF